MSHARPTPRRVALAVLAAAAAAALGGCADGRSHEPLSGAPVGDTQQAAAASAVPAPEPAPAAPEAAAPDPGTAPAAAAADDDQAAKAKARRARSARRARRKERAEARERRQRAQPAAAPRERPQRAAAQQQAKPEITASDVGDAAPVAADPDVLSARAQVLTFHRLLDEHDPSACDLLTPRLLQTQYGGDDPAGRCRGAVEAITLPVSAKILSAAADRGVIRVRVRSRMGDYARVQDVQLVLLDGAWLLDALRPVGG